MRKLALRTLGPVLTLLALLPAAEARPSTLTDFQARQVLTTLCLGQSEILLRAQPVSSVSVPAPEPVASWLALVSESVSALARTASAGAPTKEQRKIMADGLNAVAAMLRDHEALARNRGYEGAASMLAGLESTCRAALERL